jgi:hypothetical protein
LQLTYPVNADGTVSADAPSSVAFKPPLLASLGFVRPFGWSDNLYLKYLSLGFTYAADLDAPYVLGTDQGNHPVLQPNGLLRVAQSRAAQLMGIDLEMKVYRSAHADLKPFVDYSFLLGGGGGLTAGMLGRFTLGGEKPHALRAMAALRYFPGNYLPAYFDTFYEVQKYQFVTGATNPSALPAPLTKLQYVLEGNSGTQFVGYAAELSYSYNQGFAATIVYEDGYAATRGAFPVTPLGPPIGFDADKAAQTLRSLTAHVEYPVYSWVQFFATVSKRGFDWSGIFNRDQNLIFYAQLRIHLLPVLFLNAGAFETYAVDPTYNVFHNTFGFNFSLEGGYEFDRKRKR